MKILLISGHGQGDPGASGNGYNESDLTRKITERLHDILDDYAEVTLYPVDLNAVKQSRAGNVPYYASYDYVFEVHMNSFDSESAHGCEILVHPDESGVSVESEILTNLSTYFTNRGIKRRSDLLNMNNCVSRGTSYALLETCFITSTSDMVVFDSYFNEICNAVCDGIIEGFGLVQNQTHNEALYRVQVGAYRERANAENMGVLLQNDGFDYYIKVSDDGLYRVQAGAFSQESNAREMAEELTEKGYDAFITH